MSIICLLVSFSFFFFLLIIILKYLLAIKNAKKSNLKVTKKALNITSN